MLVSENKKFVIRCRAIILHDNKLLIVRHAHEASFCALPGGHLEWNEDPHECLEREIFEELGVKPKIGKLLYVNTFIENNTQPIEFFFEVLNGEEYIENKQIASHAHELTGIHWMRPDEEITLLPKKFSEDFRQGKVLSDEVRFIRD